MTTAERQLLLAIAQFLVDEGSFGRRQYLQDAIFALQQEDAPDVPRPVCRCIGGIHSEVLHRVPAEGRTRR